MNVSLGMSMTGIGVSMGMAPPPALLPCAAATPLLYCGGQMLAPQLHPQLRPPHHHQHQHQNQQKLLPSAAAICLPPTTTLMALTAAPPSTDSAYASNYASRYASAVASAVTSGHATPSIHAHLPAPRQAQHLQPQQPQKQQLHQQLIQQHQLQLQQPQHQHQNQQSQKQQRQHQQQPTASVSDSCYASRAGSALHSRVPSPTRARLTSVGVPSVATASAATATATAAAAAAASAGQPRRESRAPSPTAGADRRASPYAVVLPRGQTRLLDETSAVQLCRRSLQEELESAVRWLGTLDWTSAAAFEAASDEAAVMEDEFRGSYDREPPTVSSLNKLHGDDDDNEGESDSEQQDAENRIVLADTLLSMVEAAWADEQEDDDELGIAGRPIQAQQRAVKPKKEDAIYNVRYKTLPCLHWQKNRTCPAGDHCHFAHGPQELRQPQRHPKFKTQVCQNFKRTGRCLFGNRCFFKHIEE